MTERMPIKEAKKKFIKRSFYCGVVAILVCWFMKLFGFDYFGLDLDNKFFNDLDNFMSNNYYAKQIYYSCTLFLQMIFLNAITQNDTVKNTWKYTLFTLPIIIILRVITSIYEVEFGNMAVIIELFITIFVVSKFNLKKIPRGILVCVISIIYQAISMNMRSLELKAHTNGFMISQILSIDYYILLYLHKEVTIMNDGTLFFFGFTSWLYRVAGFIVGLFTFHPIKKSREWYEKGKAKEDARKAKKATK
jgi:hypothetical protein